MQLVIKNPSKLHILDADESEIKMVKDYLSYKDKKVEEALRRAKNSFWLKQKMGDEKFQYYLDDLKLQVKKTLLFEDQDGFWTYPGLAPRIAHLMRCPVNDLVASPEGELIPWATMPYPMRPYQQGAYDGLISARHSHVELCTGAGKTLALLYLTKNLGLKAAIVAPSANIASQIYKLFVTHLGKKYVGMFGDGKKEIGKKFTVAIAQSVTRVEPETEEWDHFQSVEAVIIDESHMFAADTFESILMGPLSNAKRRHFFSATQERNDGRDLMLEGLIGERVYTKTLKELQAEGYLAKLNTIMFEVYATTDQRPKDVKKLNQLHFYGNRNIVDKIQSIVLEANSKGIPTLILIDEHGQEEILRQKLGNIYEYAHGKADNAKIVDNFNSGKTLCVVGTSAVSVGTDFKPVRLTINWQANQAGTKIKQGAIGRSTRLDERTGKTDCKIIDFKVVNVPTLDRHAQKRLTYYQEAGDGMLVKANGVVEKWTQI